MNVTSYSSFAEVAAAMGIKPVSRVTSDKEKLKSQQEKFIAKHKCRSCGEPMMWVKGTSVMTCTNPKCKGIKEVKKDAEGNDVVSYRVSYGILDETGTEIAGNIFNGEA